MNRRKKLKDKHMKKIKKANLKENPNNKERYYSKADRALMVTAIVAPDQFTTTPWKNGQGSTMQLAINDGATVDDFNWRISIADVIEDGAYSSFEGYMRHLTVIDGKGTELTHNATQTELVEPFMSSAFDGGCQTLGKVVGGPIKNFNVMTKQATTLATVVAHQEQTTIPLHGLTQYYCYSPSNDLMLVEGEQETVLPANHLLCYLGKDATISGESIIVVTIEPAAS